MLSDQDRLVLGIGRSYRLLRRMQTRALAAETAFDADAEFVRIDTLARAAGHVAVANSLRQGVQGGIAEVEQLLEEYGPRYDGVPGTSRYSRDPYLKARELLLNVSLLRDCISDGGPIPLSPRLNGQIVPFADVRQYLAHHRRLYSPMTDNVDAFARQELTAACIGQNKGDEFEVVSMAIDPVNRRTVLRSDVQVTESDPIIFLDQILNKDTLNAARAGLEAHAGHAIDPIVP